LLTVTTGNENVGVDVIVNVGVMLGVKVIVGVKVSVGARVSVGWGVSVGATTMAVAVGVACATGDTPQAVSMIISTKTAGDLFNTKDTKVTKVGRAIIESPFRRVSLCVLGVTSTSLNASLCGKGFFI